MQGPLQGIRIIEIAGQGALPFGALKLGDMGAEIIRIERTSDVPVEPQEQPHNFWDRGRRSIAVDLKRAEGVELVLRLATTADAILESFRPGVVERLGLGPEPVFERNPKIVYGRLTGWGQEGPLAQAAGHSLNYEAITGYVRAVGAAGGTPVPALQVFGDFAGGGMHLAYGVVCALLEAQRSGKGQVVDVSMVDGVMALVAPFYAMHQMGMHSDEIGTNLFDGGAPFYNVYETSDGNYVSVGPLESKFWAQLLEKLQIDPAGLPDQNDRQGWPQWRGVLADKFKTKTRAEWTELLQGTDCCFAPVLSFSESMQHPHNVERNAFLATEPMPELAPAPRFSRTPGKPRRSPRWPGADTDDVLRETGLDDAELAALRAAGVVA